MLEQDERSDSLVLNRTCGPGPSPLDGGHAELL